MGAAVALWGLVLAGCGEILIATTTAVTKGARGEEAGQLVETGRQVFHAPVERTYEAVVAAGSTQGRTVQNTDAKLHEVRIGYRSASLHHAWTSLLVVRCVSIPAGEGAEEGTLVVIRGGSRDDLSRAREQGAIMLSAIAASLDSAR